MLRFLHTFLLCPLRRLRQVPALLSHRLARVASAPRTKTPRRPLTLFTAALRRLFRPLPKDRPQFHRSWVASRKTHHCRVPYVANLRCPFCQTSLGASSMCFFIVSGPPVPIAKGTPFPNGFRLLKGCRVIVQMICIPFHAFSTYSAVVMTVVFLSLQNIPVFSDVEHTMQQHTLDTCPKAWCHIMRS